MTSQSFGDLATFGVWFSNWLVQWIESAADTSK